MNVNKNDEKEKRIRRTPEEAKKLILKAAANRLSKLGLEGLNISGVAKDAGMSHATVIHHFGSTAEMRNALLREMTRALLADVVEALAHHESPDHILSRLFEKLSQDGHGKLLAWLALDGQAQDPTPGDASLFNSIIDSIEAESGDRQHAKQIVYLVAIAAMGKSICGERIAGLIGMDDSEQQHFPAWLANHLEER